MPEFLVSFAKKATEKMVLADSADAKAYRLRYPDKEARRAPEIIYGSHFTGDTFFHGPGLSNEAQYMSELYRVDDYVITEMEASGLMQVLVRHGFADKAISLRAAVNFDQGHPKESTLAHLDPAPGETAGGFDQALQNMHAVGLQLINGLTDNHSALKVSLKKATSTTDDSCSVDTELLIQPKDY
jgi:purine nucleoside permease